MSAAPLSLRSLAIAAASLSFLVVAPCAGAQQPLPPVDSLLRACLAAAEQGDSHAAISAASAAERVLSAAAGAHTGDPQPLVGMARTRVQCRMPFASATERGELFAEAVELLERAIALDPAGIPARLTLAFVLGRAPRFLGRDAQAIAQIEWLLSRLGDQRGLPELPMLHVTLGELHARNGRAAEARAAWERGRALFPAHPELAARLGASPAAGPAAPEAPRPDSSPTRQEAAAPAALAQVTISAVSPMMRASRTARAMTSLEVVTTPGGTADVFQALQLLPGVTRASESSDLALRGGDPVEAPVYVDGARLTYASKFESLDGGMFGVLDPAVLRSARVLAGGFSARYGDALSGVVLVETLGRPTGVSTRLGVNTTGAGASVIRPLGEQAGGWATLRATETGLMLRTHGRADQYPTVPYSIEGMGGFARQFGTVQARVTALAETDASGRLVSAGGHSGSYESRGSTGLLTGALSGVGAGRIGTWSVTTALSSRGGSTSFGALDRERMLLRWGSRAEVSGMAGEALMVNVGAEGALIRETVHGRVPTTGHFGPDAPAQTLQTSARDATHAGGWVEAEWSPRVDVVVTAGMRGDRLPGASSWTADPRLGVALLRGAWSGSLAGGVFHQGRWRPREDRPDREPSIGIAGRARHLVASVEHAGSTTMRAEAYVKSYDRYEQGVARWSEAEISPAARARVRGVDLLVRPPALGPLRSWATYSLLDARAELEDGSVVATNLDVTHSLAAVGRLTLTGAWELGSTLRFASGRPYTPILGAETLDGVVRPIRGETFGARHPVYARLDTRLTRSLRVGDGMVLGYLEALNVLDRGNIASYSYDATFRHREAVPYFFGRRSFVLGLEARF